MKKLGTIIFAIGTLAATASGASAGCVCSNSSGNWYCAPDPVVCIKNFGYACNPYHECKQKHGVWGHTHSRVALLTR